MPGELPQFYMFPCSNGNEKEGKKLNESCLRKGRFLYSCVLLWLGNTLKLTPLSAPPLGEQRNAWVLLITLKKTKLVYVFTGYKMASNYTRKSLGVLYGQHNFQGTMVQVC
jgi:hypothetical protein